MRKKFSRILTLLLAFVVHITFAQEKTISGTISDEDGLPLPGVNILVKGTTNGTQTDFDGNYSILANTGDVLTYSFIGYKTLEKPVEASNTISFGMQIDAQAIDEVVVTALGISRDKKSIGYAAQKVGGEEVSTVKVDNVVNSLSGKVSGVQIKANNNFGGSSNFLIRGVSSLTGNNQPLFVVDGIPLSNRVNNTAAQQSGGTGYDYGNAAADINPDDVESINILKGAAASAIYGSRGANGVVIITTKKGKSGKAKVTVSSATTVGNIDKTTFLKYQDKYGAGYGPYYGSTGYFQDIDMDGDGNKDLVVPTYDDASYGAPLDGSLVYQWDSFIPEHPNYLKATPYVAGASTPADFFETSYQLNNSVSVLGGNDKISYRLGYTNFSTTGMLPNSKLKKNTVNFSSTLKVSDNFKVGANSNLLLQDTKGRNSTGYNDNLMGQFRQWWQVNVDMQDMEDIFNQTGKNYTWNHEGPLNGNYLQPHYWDNPYWTRYKNFQTDKRNRFFGNLYGTHAVTKWLDFTAKAGIDTYAELREERRAVGSVATPFGVSRSGVRSQESSGYDRTEINFTEMNYDFMLNLNTQLSEKLSLSGVTGINIRKEKYELWHGSTNGGLANPGVFALTNSVLPLNIPQEILTEKQVNGIYAQASFGYDNLLYVDLTDRYDVSSALPQGKNAYNYFGISSSFVFSKPIEATWLNYGKIRAGYAEVGNDLPANNVFDSYRVIDHFGSVPLSSFANTKNNQELLPERTKELEFGIESRILDSRIGIDFTWYKKNTENQLMAVATSAATGFTNKWVNAGEIQNKGIELGLNLTPVKNENLTWDVNINMSKNENLVVSLYEDDKGNEVENIQIAAFGGGISINATKGQPYGTIRGTGYEYLNGQKVVDANGYYKAKADQVLGDVNPDWNGGITNKVSYKNTSLSFLIDMQKGGSVYSLDMHYGQGTGLPDYTAGNNELGNPIRDPLSDGGGILFPGVKEDGTPNDVRAPATAYSGAYYWGNSSRNPAAMTVYDASFVKLREVALTHKLPVKKWFSNGAISDASIALVGRNLWIIDKKVPFADPESGLGAGNAQGYLSGSYPTLRTYGLTLNMEF